MQQRRWLRLLRQIAQTREDEIDCDHCAPQVPAFVEAKLDNHDGDGQYELVRLHLFQCRTCAEIAEALYQLVVCEREGNWISITRLVEIIREP